MVDEQSLLIGELAEHAGVSVRTIRYYIEEGLLPSPRVQGKYTVYDDEYIARIQLIRFLKDSYLPLREIRSILEQLDGPEIRSLLAQFERGESPRLPPAANASFTTPAAGANAVEYISSINASRSTLNTRRNRSTTASPAPQAEPLQPGLLYQKSIQESPVQPAPSVWQRVVLAPGVELHILENDDRRLKHRVQKLIAYAANLFH